MVFCYSGAKTEAAVLKKNTDPSTTSLNHTAHFSSQQKTEEGKLRGHWEHDRKHGN